MPSEGITSAARAAPLTKSTRPPPRLQLLLLLLLLMLYVRQRCSSSPCSISRIRLATSKCSFAFNVSPDSERAIPRFWSTRAPRGVSKDSNSSKICFATVKPATASSRLPCRAYAMAMLANTSAPKGPSTSASLRILWALPKSSRASSNSSSCNLQCPRFECNAAALSGENWPTALSVSSARLKSLYALSSSPASKRTSPNFSCNSAPSMELNSKPAALSPCRASESDSMAVSKSPSPACTLPRALSTLAASTAASSGSKRPISIVTRAADNSRKASSNWPWARYAAPRRPRSSAAARLVMAD
mmetsp:Transcript_25735/g.64884  ORF Transcript_25735/g.64884 Transcript_25735/m.64884 type:complete len:303 (-) Transcript_25735:67-975(-)